jgi:hypothetical protein
MHTWHVMHQDPPELRQGRGQWRTTAKREGTPQRGGAHGGGQAA